MIVESVESDTCRQLKEVPECESKKIFMCSNAIAEEVLSK